MYVNKKLHFAIVYQQTYLSFSTIIRLLNLSKPIQARLVQINQFSCVLLFSQLLAGIFFA